VQYVELFHHQLQQRLLRLSRSILSSDVCGASSPKKYVAVKSGGDEAAAGTYEQRGHGRDLVRRTGAAGGGCGRSCAGSPRRVVR